MTETLFYSELKNKKQFKIDYPYYGLFGSADITPVTDNAEITYKCKLLNGSTIFLKKLQQLGKWIDVTLNIETPLSAVIGVYIDDFLKTFEGYK